MRRKNYIDTYPNLVAPYLNIPMPPVVKVPPADSPSSTGTTNNKGNFWETITNIAGGLFSNKNNQPQQTDIPPQNQAENKPNYGLIIGIIVAAIVVGVAIYFMTRK